MNSNNVITFGSWSTASTNLGAATPSLPAIHIGSKDSSYLAVWAGNAGSCYR